MIVLFVVVFVVDPDIVVVDAVVVVGCRLFFLLSALFL